MVVQIKVAFDIKRPDAKETRPDTRTGIVACGWAGAVMWGAGAAGGPVYTTTSVSCDWAGAVMRKPLANAKKSIAGQTDRPTDRPTD